MSNLLRFIAAVCLGLIASFATATPRNSEPINRDWIFTLGNPANAQAADHDTSPWRRADLPHSFSEPYFLGTGFYGTRWEQIAEAKGGRKSHDFALFDRPLTATLMRIRFLNATPDRPAALREVRVIAKPAH